MKKAFKSYLSVWAVLLILFNVIAFVSVGWSGQEKYTASFWIGYCFITLAFAGQLVCAFVAFNAENNQKLFYNIPLITLSYTGLIVSFVAGGLCMLISPLPYWVGVIACAIVLAFTAISVINAQLAASSVDTIDTKIKASTSFIKLLTVDAESLVARAKSDAIKAECKKVYEAVRYSDPVSNDALASIESEITIKFAKLSDAVSEDNSKNVSEFANEIIILLGDRNKKCKVIK